VLLFVLEVDRQEAGRPLDGVPATTEELGGAVSPAVVLSDEMPQRHVIPD
jgi:hypothetical protein